jgi:hypothetical protein
LLYAFALRWKWLAMAALTANVKSFIVEASVLGFALSGFILKKNSRLPIQNFRPKRNAAAAIFFFVENLNLRCGYAAAKVAVSQATFLQSN